MPVQLYCPSMSLRRKTILVVDEDDAAREAVGASLPGAPGIGRQVAGDDGIGAAVDRVFGAGLESPGETARLLDLQALDTAVDRLLAARRVEWVGMGSAAVTAAARSLSRSGMAAVNCLVSGSLGVFSDT